MSFAWPVDRTCLPALPAESDPGYAVALGQRNAAENLAVHVLWALTGRQFGATPTVVRPCPTPSSLCGAWGLGRIDWQIMETDLGAWHASPCACGSSGCTVSGPRVIHLPGPVAEIVTVTIEGAVLPDTDYQLEGDALYRIGGIWPAQDLGKPLGETGTWAVEYQRGLSAPADAGAMTGLLAKEFLAACGEGKCRLPRNVTGVTRQGVSFQVYNPQQIYANGKTGLSEVDLWLSAINPAALTMAPTVR